MASEHTIKMNFENAKRQANELSDIAERVSEIATGKLTESIENIDKNWDGANSKKFLKKSNELKAKVEDSAKDIAAVADAIRKMAKAVYDAEMKNIETAKTRSYQ